AMVVAAVPESVMTRAARAVVDPYLMLFNLDNYWGFFDDVGTSYQFRYIVEDAAGQQHTFIPADELSRFSPSFIWLLDHYRLVMDYVDTYGDVTVAELCQEHAALHPAAITLLSVVGKPFGPEDRRAGKHPLDQEFITVKPLKTIQCRARSPSRPRRRQRRRGARRKAACLPHCGAGSGSGSRTSRPRRSRSPGSASRRRCCSTMAWRRRTCSRSGATTAGCRAPSWSGWAPVLHGRNPSSSISAHPGNGSRSTR